MITKLEKVIVVSSSSIAAPVIQEAIGSVIHLPDVADGGTYVVPPYQGMKVGDLVTAHYKTCDADWQGYAVVSSSNVGQPVYFRVTKEAFKIGQSTAFYQVTDTSGNSLQSPSSFYEVKP